MTLRAARYLATRLAWAVLGALVYALVFAPNATSTPRSEAVFLADTGNVESGQPQSGESTALPYAADSGQLGPIPLAAERTSAPTPTASFGLGTGRRLSTGPAAGAPSPSPSARPQSGVAQPVERRAEVAKGVGSSPTPGTIPRLPKAVRGVASWWDSFGHGYYAAMPGYIDGTVVQAVVNSFHDGRTWSVTVVVTTQCGCPDGRLIDLSADAFLALGWPLSRGIAPVEVSILEGKL